MYTIVAILSGLVALGLFMEPDPGFASPWAYVAIVCFCLIMLFLDKYRAKNRRDSLLYGVGFWLCWTAMTVEGHQNPFGFLHWAFIGAVIFNALAWIWTVAQQIRLNDTAKQ